MRISRHSLSTLLRELTESISYVRQTMRWRLLLVLVVCFWLWFYLPLWAEPPAVSITIRPRVTMVGQLVRVTVKVPQHPANRELWLYWGVEAEGMYSNSLVQLDGDSQATRMTYWFEREMTTSGRWKFTARLLRNDNTEKTAVEFVEVSGTGDPGGW